MSVKQRADEPVVETGLALDANEAVRGVLKEAASGRADPQTSGSIFQQRVNVVVRELSLIEDREAYAVESDQAGGRAEPESSRRVSG